MAEKFTVAQMQRLTELNGEQQLAAQTFESADLRNQRFKDLELALVKESKAKLAKLLHGNEPGCALKQAIRDGKLDPKRFNSFM